MTTREFEAHWKRIMLNWMQSLEKTPESVALHQEYWRMFQNIPDAIFDEAISLAINAGVHNYNKIPMPSQIGVFVNSISRRIQAQQDGQYAPEVADHLGMGFVRCLSAAMLVKMRFIAEPGLLDHAYESFRKTGYYPQPEIDWRTAETDGVTVAALFARNWKNHGEGRDLRKYLEALDEFSPELTAAVMEALDG